VRRLDHIRRDCQVVVEEIGGLPVIGIDPADRRGGKENDIGTLFIEPSEDCGLIAQIEDFSAQSQEPAILFNQPPHQGRAHIPLCPATHTRRPWRSNVASPIMSTRTLFLGGGASYRLRPIKT